MFGERPEIFHPQTLTVHKKPEKANSVGYATIFVKANHSKARKSHSVDFLQFF